MFTSYQHVVKRVGCAFDSRECSDKTLEVYYQPERIPSLSYGYNYTIGHLQPSITVHPSLRIPTLFPRGKSIATLNSAITVA